MSDPFDLRRFIDAQQGVYETARDELRAGSKQSHWMWFVFPQLRGLGRSPTAEFFGITSADETRAYLDHAILGARLRACVQTILPWAAQRSAERIFGPVDAMKLRSSLTLFDAIEADGLFASALTGFFDGDRDERTLALLSVQQ